MASKNGAGVPQRSQKGLWTQILRQSMPRLKAEISRLLKYHWRLAVSSYLGKFTVNTHLHQLQDASLEFILLKMLRII